MEKIGNMHRKFNLKITIMKKNHLVIMLSMFLSIATLAQNASVDEAVKNWERAKAYTKEYLDAMPANGYAFKPTPDMRSFAEQMLHMTDAFYGFTAAATGETSPVGLGALEKSSNKSKDSVIKTVMAGYDYVIAGLKKMSADKLNEKVKLFGRFEMTRSDAFEKEFEHQTHHRGQTTVYLRLQGAKPPQEKLF